MTRRLSLSVNHTPVATDYFVSSFIDHTLGGMMESLEGTSPIKTLDLSVDGEHVTITLNNSDIPANSFVARIVRSTIAGMVSPLKGVSDVERIEIHIER